MDKETHQKQLDMIARGNHDEIMNHVSKDSLSEEAEVALILRGDHKEIMAYVSHPRCLCEEAEFALVARGDYDELVMYMAYDCAFVQSEVQIALIKQSTQKVILKFLKSHRLCQDAELALIARGYHTEIMAYKFGYQRAAQLALVKRGEHEEIMAYISRTKFSNELPLIALIRRGNREEVKLYEEKYGFSSKIVGRFRATLERLLNKKLSNDLFHFKLRR